MKKDMANPTESTLDAQDLKTIAKQSIHRRSNSGFYQHKICRKDRPSVYGMFGRCLGDVWAMSG